MTDGIIQEVFNKYIQLHDCECSDKETNQWNKLITTKFIMIQQELIERIKQANTKNPDWDYNFSIGVKLMKIYLIGDNQE